MNDVPPAWRAIAPGTKTAFRHTITTRADGTAAAIPVLAVRGREPGSTLLVTAGIHGDEFEGMAAIRRVYGEASPEALRGTLVMVPVANPPAYEAGLRTNPDDRQDLARVFPGDRQGTVTEQIAAALTGAFIRHADFLCDLHSAGQYYAIEPWVGYKLHEATLPVQREAAALFGLPTVWGTPGLPGRTLSAASDHDVPAIYAEVTGQGGCLEADVQSYVHGIRQLLAYLKMSGEPPAPHEPACVIEDDRPGAGFLQIQNRAPCGGFFEPEVVLGQQVQEGDQVGLIVDPLGAVLAAAQATCSGRIVFLRTFSRVLAGDPLCTIQSTAGR